MQLYGLGKDYLLNGSIGESIRRINPPEVRQSLPVNPIDKWRVNISGAHSGI
jgi:hypothetical protein